jgi:hypothetical protein
VDSAACRALHLTEILDAILKHLLPPPSTLASLCAAARVNHTWFAAAVPLLWRQPPDVALCGEHSTHAARRAFYWSHIRQLHVVWQTPLWRTLAQAINADGNDAPGQGRAARVAAGPTTSRGDPHLGTLSLPRLRKLSFSVNWRYDDPFTQALRDQSLLLLPCVSANLSELSCYMTADLLQFFEALQRQRQRMRLREVSLRSLNDNPYQELAERLMDWFEAAPSPTPLLGTARFGSLLLKSPPAMISRTVHPFALRDGLEHLSLHGIQWPILALPAPLANGDAAGEKSAGLSGHKKAVEAATSGWSTNEQYCPNWLGRRPFRSLKSLHMTITARAVPSLAPLITNLTSLSIIMDDYPNDLLATTGAFCALALMPTLRSLSLGLACEMIVTGACLLALHNLTALRVLDIASGELTDDVGDAELVALVRALRHVQSLTLSMSMELSDDGVCNVLAAGPQLRDVSI